MSIDGRRTKCRRNIAENFNRLSSGISTYASKTKVMVLKAALQWATDLSLLSQFIIYLEQKLLD